MQAARPLRDVLTDLVGDGDAAGPAEVLAAGGHAGLPVELVAEAVGSFADTAPIEVAEHLSPYVMANSPVPLPDAPDVDLSGWLEAVTTAPPAPDVDPTALLDDAPADTDFGATAAEVDDISFGQGHTDTAPDHDPSTVDTHDHDHESDSGYDVDHGYEPIDGTYDHAAPDPAGLDHFPPPDHTPDDNSDDAPDAADDLPDA